MKGLRKCKLIVHLARIIQLWFETQSTTLKVLIVAQVRGYAGRMEISKKYQPTLFLYMCRPFLERTPFITS